MIEAILDFLFTVFAYIFCGLLCLAYILWIIKEFKDAANLWK